MRHTTISEKINPYMKRKEMVLNLDHPEAPTPANIALQQHFAKEWKADVEQVDIKHIYSLVGKQASRVHLFLWEEKKVKDLSKAATEKPKEGAAAPAEASKETGSQESPKK